MRNPDERGTRERILKVAEASLGEHGYHGTRLHEIARQVGIQKASLFHYFPSKEELYRAVIEEGFGETEETIRVILEAEATPIQKVRAIVTAYVDLVAEHPERTKILLRQSLGDAPTGYQTSTAERLLNSVAAIVSETQDKKAVRAMEPLALVLGVVGMVAFFSASVPVLAPTWLEGKSPEAITERVKELMLYLVDRCLMTTGQAGFAKTATASATVSSRS